MRSNVIKCFAGILIVLLLGACSQEDKRQQSSQEAELTVSAAASMKDALTEIQKLYEKEYPNVKLFFNFGASGALQQQIRQGAPVDLFLSAATDKFDSLVESGHIDNDYWTNLVGNELVLIQPKNPTTKLTGFDDLVNSNVTKISIGTPESVPAGKYSKETFETIGIWNNVKDKLVFAKDVRQVLTYVETGNVDAGVVYKTDALGSEKVRIVGSAEKTAHSPIVYPLGVIKQSNNKEEAISLFTFLKGDQAQKIFTEYGFISLIEK